MPFFAKKSTAVPQVVRTNYTSLPVDIPPDFLKSTPPDSQPLITSQIDFASTSLPEYAGYYAVVLDNVLSASECSKLLQLAEESAGAGKDGVQSNGWRPAMVNAGLDHEVMVTDYRNSDRIIWDNHEIVDRLLARCLASPQVAKDLAVIHKQDLIQGRYAVAQGDKWTISRLNERLRFLRYGKGQFFRAHCDGTFENPDPEKNERSFYTLHLYLNDSKNECPQEEGVELVGGATTFHSRKRENKKTLDVHPKVGRVLIFQHSGLRHSGADVKAGIKYTVRTDLMYNYVPTEKEMREEEQ